MNVKEIRELLPKASIKDFDDIVNGVVLGASNHIKMIIDMYVKIAEENDRQEAIDKIDKVGEYFKETRGKSSYAIVIALNKVEKRIKESSIVDIKEAVSEARKSYYAEADDDLKKLLTYTKRLMKNYHSAMIFDYSSTVEKAICNIDDVLDVYIPESRVIDGGYPFIKKIVEKGHKVHFVADAAMLSVLDKVDIVFIGAETFYPDGTAFNTVGSDILAELCIQHNVPYYVLTPLLKCDIRAIYGIYKETLKTNLRERLAKDWPEDLKQKVDFTSIELVGVDPKLITGYVTEKGILRTSDLYAIVTKED